MRHHTLRPVVSVDSVIPEAMRSSGRRWRGRGAMRVAPIASSRVRCFADRVGLLLLPALCKTHAETRRIGIIHIDEVDKLARRGGQESGTWGGGRDVGGEGVQQALLRLLEGTTLTLNAKPPAISSNPNSPSGGSAGPSGGSGGLGGLGGSGTKAAKDTLSTSSGALNGPAFGMGAGKSPSGAASSDPPGWDPNNPMNRTFAQGKKGVREGLPGYGGGSGGGSQSDISTRGRFELI